MILNYDYHNSSKHLVKTSKSILNYHLSIFSTTPRTDLHGFINIKISDNDYIYLRGFTLFFFILFFNDTF